MCLTELKFVEIGTGDKTDCLTCEPCQLLLLHMTNQPWHITWITGDPAAPNQPSYLLRFVSEPLQEPMCIVCIHRLEGQLKGAGAMRCLGFGILGQCGECQSPIAEQHS